LKFQAVAEKTAKDARGLLYFAAPTRYILGQNKARYNIFYNNNKTVNDFNIFKFIIIRHNVVEKKA